MEVVKTAEEQALKTSKLQQSTDNNCRAFSEVTPDSMTFSLPQAV